VIPLIEARQHIGAIALIHNVTELRRKDKALDSKDATIKEIHHRVKNNLQTVSALLRLQSRRVEDPAAQTALDEAVRRVASIAIVHETLAISSAESVDFDQVFDRIIHNALELSSKEITYKKTGEFGVFDNQKATPLALIITELIHNALEHGLEKGGDQLFVEINRSSESTVVKVIDNGVGLPSDFSIVGSSNLGLQIVKTLTENELKGSISIVRNNGLTEAVLKF
jgi:two-component sensor histidine kinase